MIDPQDEFRLRIAIGSPRDDVSGSLICFGFAEAVVRLALAPLRLRWRFCAVSKSLLAGSVKIKD